MIQLPDESRQGSLLADLTPLLDVIFIVLVFLLLTANTPMLDIPVSLPGPSEAVSIRPDDDKRTPLVLYRDGHWRLAEQSYPDWLSLRAILQEGPAMPLDIAVEDGAEASPLLQLLAWLNAEGRTDTRLLMEQSDAK
jgi:biopolymer transport protein ExbD